MATMTTKRTTRPAAISAAKEDGHRNFGLNCMDSENIIVQSKSSLSWVVLPLFRALVFLFAHEAKQGSLASSPTSCPFLSSPRLDHLLLSICALFSLSYAPPIPAFQSIVADDAFFFPSLLQPSILSRLIHDDKNGLSTSPPESHLLRTT